MEINELTGIILKQAYEVHTVLSPGLLESTYEECLCHELIRCGFMVERQKALPIVYKRHKIECRLPVGYSSQQLGYHRVETGRSSQSDNTSRLLTYLKLSKIHYGLLINFNVRSLKEGIKRYIM